MRAGVIMRSQLDHCWMWQVRFAVPVPVVSRLEKLKARRDVLLCKLKAINTKIKEMI